MNRNVSQPAELTVSLDGASLTALSAELLHAADLKSANSFDAPDQVVSRAFDGWRSGELAQTELPPHSFLATTFELT